MSLSQNLKNLRLAHHLSQGEVARTLGISRPAYGFWEKGTARPKKDNLEKLAKLFQTNIADLTQDNKADLLRLYDTLSHQRQDKVLAYTKQQQADQNKEHATDTLRHLVPNKVYEKLSAGTGYGYFEDGTYDIAYSDKAYDYDFASWVSGDSMTPEYENGAVALIRQTTFDYDGAIYAVEWDGQTYIKHVYREKNGLRLVSANPDYPDKFAPFDEAPRIIGKIVGHFTPIEKRD
jgi:repressor LexA